VSNSFLSFSLACPIAAPVMRPDFLLRLWLYINLLLTYLLTQGAHRKVPTVRRLVTSSITSRDYDVIRYTVTSQCSKSLHSETWIVSMWTLTAHI